MPKKRKPCYEHIMKCHHGLIQKDGVTVPMLHHKQTLRNVTVEILECSVCGECSIGWYRQEDTEEV